MSQLGNGRVDIFSVLGLFFVIRVCPLSCAVKRGCGFRCVGGIQNFEHPPTDIPRNATDTDNYAWCVAKLVYSVASYS